MEELHENESQAPDAPRDAVAARNVGRARLPPAAPDRIGDASALPPAATGVFRTRTARKDVRPAGSSARPWSGIAERWSVGYRGVGLSSALLGVVTRRGGLGGGGA